MLNKLVGALLLMAPMAYAQDVNVETYRGAASVASGPEKIVVFDLAAMDTLDALGVDPAGLVTPRYVSYLDHITAAPIGSLFEPDIEAVLGIDPDLIIVGGRSSTQFDAMSDLAPTIDMTIWEDIVGQGLDRLEAYGEIFGKQTEAAALEADFQNRLATAKAAVAGQGNALIVMTNGPQVSAYGASGRFGWLHNTLALPEAVAEVEQATHGEAISFEFIKDANPDILIVIDRLSAIGQPGEAAVATLDNALVHETAAWKNDKVIYLDASAIYIAGGGIQAMGLVLDQIAAGMAGS